MHAHVHALKKKNLKMHVDENEKKSRTPNEIDSGVNSRSAGLDIAPVLHVNGVHLSKVIHVGQEDIDLDDLCDIGAGLLEDVGQVLDALVLFDDMSLESIG